MGPGEMHPRVLREMADVIARPLYNLCSIMATGRSAQRLEESVTPIFKNGKKEDPVNYRQVSLTLMSGKMVE